MDISIFERVETKYLLSKDEYEQLLKIIEEHLEKDKYFFNTICNVYFDTDTYEIVRNSIEKPVYKDKFRVRSYGVPKKDDKVFFEIKRKYKGTVYKRRVSAKLSEVEEYLENGKYPEKANTQIMKEIDYFFSFYSLKPKVFIAYDRYSYLEKENSNFRITFDKNIRSRTEEIALENGDKGDLLLADGTCVMETKTLGAYPKWFVDALSKLKIYPKSFTKYGNVYKNQIYKEGVMSYV
ncbi:MAG: polyphosphate polymerase domain-containing protein [Clostridia bacterium]|nr:polyphosphate polymerase domain-containing protein [Clostridia bacterium]